MKQRYRIVWFNGIGLIIALNKAAYLYAKKEGYLVLTINSGVQLD